MKKDRKKERDIVMKGKKGRWIDIEKAGERRRRERERQRERGGGGERETKRERRRKRERMALMGEGIKSLIPLLYHQRHTQIEI